MAGISLILKFSGKPKCHQGWRIEIDSHVKSVECFNNQEKWRQWSLEDRMVIGCMWVWGRGLRNFLPSTTHRGSKVYQANPQRLQKHNKLHEPPLWESYSIFQPKLKYKSMQKWNRGKRKSFIYHYISTQSISYPSSTTNRRTAWRQPLSEI